MINILYIILKNKQNKCQFKLPSSINTENVELLYFSDGQIVDVLKEEAERDYQMAAGLTQDVDSDDSILDLTKARLPWLFLGLIGGVGAFLIILSGITFPFGPLNKSEKFLSLLQLIQNLLLIIINLGCNL